MHTHTLSPSDPRALPGTTGQVLAIASRELSSFFRSMGGWIIIALYVALAAIVFASVVLVPAKPASMRPFFELSGWLLLPVAPAVSMRLLADELRTGTIEPLMTSPVSALAIVLGKYLGAVAFVAAMIAPTLLFPIILHTFSDPAPDVGPIITGYACLLLLGMLSIAVGLAASACTSNATLAFLVTLFVLLALLLAGVGARFVEGVPRTVLEAIALPARLGDFAKGVLDTSHVVYFLSLSLLGCAVAALVLQARRSA
jgi:ABC-2 type transport system permease protein